MLAYAALGTPDSIRITRRHIFRLLFAERATHRPSQARSWKFSSKVYPTAEAIQDY